MLLAALKSILPCPPDSLVSLLNGLTLVKIKIEAAAKKTVPFGPIRT
jgi:hypothetical protein